MNFLYDVYIIYMDTHIHNLRIHVSCVHMCTWICVSVNISLLGQAFAKLNLCFVIVKTTDGSFSFKGALTQAFFISTCYMLMRSLSNDIFIIIFSQRYIWYDYDS